MSIIGRNNMDFPYRTNSSMFKYGKPHREIISEIYKAYLIQFKHEPVDTQYVICLIIETCCNCLD